MEEGVVLRRGSLVLCPFGGEEHCGVGAPPSVPNLHQQFGATSWKDSQPHGEEEQRREVKRATKGKGKDSEGPFGVKQFLKGVSFFLFVYSSARSQVPLLYFIYFAKYCSELRSKLEVVQLEIFVLPSSTKTQPHAFLLSRYVGAFLLRVSISLPKIALFLQILLTFGDEGQFTAPL
jgi:hypothetical protein